METATTAGLTRLAHVNGFRSSMTSYSKPEVDDDDVSNGSSTLLDENEEWAKIENIMASLDAGLTDSSVVAASTKLSSSSTNHTATTVVKSPPLPLGSPTVDDTSRTTIGQFLTSVGLGQFEDILVEHGFDDLDFITAEFLNESDLIEIGVHDEDSRQRLLSALSSVPHRPTPTPTQFESVHTWLKSLRLSEYLETFLTHGFTTIDRLRNLCWDVQLTSVLQITRLGHRNRILTAVGTLPAPAVPTSSSPVTRRSSHCLDDDDRWPSCKPAKQSLNELSLYKDYTTLLHTRSKTSHSLSVDRSQRRTPVTQRTPDCRPHVATTLPTRRENGVLPSQHARQLPREPRQLQDAVQLNPAAVGASNSATECLRLRPPQTYDSHAQRWTHHPNVLLHDGCTYNTQYVGSGVVRDLENPDSTRETIVSIREASASQRRSSVAVSLTISHAGVKYRHRTTDEVLGSHDIGNIFCTCQDASLLDYFAYVTWQPDAGVHECHVFCADNVNMAIEMVLTLGQAFEVAYQLAIVNNGSSTVGTSASTEPTQIATPYTSLPRVKPVHNALSNNVRFTTDQR